MGKVKGKAYERSWCLVCGADLERKATGRPRRFYSDACKQKDYRQFRKWVRVSVDAALAGRAEPPMSWRYETRLIGGSARQRSERL